MRENSPRRRPFETLNFVHAWATAWDELTSISYITEELSSRPITKDLVLRAGVHLERTKKEDLFSADLYRQAIATGYLYESVLYEMVLQLAQESRLISRFVLRRNDVPMEFRKPRASIGQNGFFYSPSGEITVRGDGADLGEFDSLVFDDDGKAISFEAMISTKNIKGLVKEIHYKRHLLQLLLGRDSEFVFVSPEDLAAKKVGRELVQQGDCTIVRTAPIDKVMEGLSPRELDLYKPQPRDLSKGILATEIQVAGMFNYRAIHDRARLQLLDALRPEAASGQVRQVDLDPLLARLIVGQLDDDAVDALLQRWSFTIKGHKISPKRLRSQGSTMTLVLRLPELRPGFYFRSKDLSAFVKFGPFKRQEFGCEGVIFPWTTLFFRMLESYRYQVSAPLVIRVLDECLTDEVTKQRVKRRGSREKRAITRLFGMTW